MSPYRESVEKYLSANHRVETYDELSPEDRFRFYCYWEGLLGWDSELIRALRVFGFTVRQKERKPGRKPGKERR